MADLRLTINGTFSVGTNHSILFLEESGNQYFLAFAFQVRGGEQLLFPDSLLDDWGHEFNSLSLYPWLQKNGSDFPRAEIFGQNQFGDSLQAFVREIDLMSNFPCFLFENRDDPILAGKPVTDIVIAAPGLSSPEPASGAHLFNLPLSKALVQWWQIDPSEFGDNFARILLQQP